MKILTLKEALADLNIGEKTDHLLSRRVAHLISCVKQQGDRAVRRIALSLGDPPPCEISLVKSEKLLEKETLAVLQKSSLNISRFACKTSETARDFKISFDSHSAGMRWMPVKTAGCYVPGGRFPLASTALMTISAAKAAGVQNIVVCSPDSSDEILAACSIAGADRFFRMGGVQAVAALAFGTETVPRADVIAGPGNRWVTEAKRQLIGTVGIDMLAGPSEVAVVVNESSDPELAAVDLLAQAEHDPEASAWCVSLSSEKTADIISALTREASVLSIEPGERIKLLNAASMEEAADFCNHLAPEHLQLSVNDPDSVFHLFTSFGAAFLGENTSVPMGDYSAGPNHTLPTGSTARFSGGLTPLVFLRPQTWVRNSGRLLPELAGSFAKIEGLAAHEKSCRLR